MANIKETIPFSFEEIYSDLVKRMSKKGYDAPYEGSNLAQLITLLSYSISSLNFNTAVNINENILELARKRKNIIQDARMLSYEPKVKVSYMYKIYFKTKVSGSYIIPRWTKIKINNIEFLYCDDDYIFQSTKAGDIFSIVVKQGQVETSDENKVLNYVLNEKDYIDIPYDDVEEDGIRVSATFYTDDGIFVNNKLLTKRNLSSMDKNDNYDYNFFRKDDLKTSNARIFFKMNGLGTTFPKGTAVKVDVIRTKGKEGNPGDIKDITSDIKNIEFISSGINAPILLQVGNNGESDQSIKENAPLFLNAASRVVTSYDYKAVAQSHNAVDRALIWGGEDEFPVTLGNLYYSFTPERAQDKFEIYSLEGYDDNNEEIWKKEGNSNDTSVISEKFHYKLADYADSDLRFLRENEFFSNTVIDGVIQNKGVCDILDMYKLPALKTNIRNPVYVYCDLYVNIKKYPYGTPSFKTRQEIFEAIQEYFKKIQGFEAKYYNSNLIRTLDNILGTNNGVEIYPKFRILLKKENIAKTIEKNEEFSNVNCFIKSFYVNNSLNVTLYLSGNSHKDDEVSLFFNQKLNGSKEWYSKVTEEDRKSGVKIYSFPVNYNVENISVDYQSYDGLSESKGKDVLLYNFKNKKLFYEGIFNQESTELTIILPRFVKYNDEITIKGIFEGNEYSLTKIIIKDEDLEKGFVKYIDLKRTEFAGIVGAENYKIEYTSDPNSQNPQKLYGELATSLQDAKELTQNQDNIFSNNSLNEVFYNYKQDRENVSVKVWLADYVKTNDIIEIEVNDKHSKVLITDNMIQERSFEYTIKIDPLKVVSYTYKGQDSSIKIYPIELKEANTIKDVDDDSLAIENKTLHNFLEHNATTTYDGIFGFKENVSITFLTKYYNKFDVRNLFKNFDDNAVISIRTTPEMKIQYSYPYISSFYPTKKETYNINVDVELNGELYSKNINVFITDGNRDVLNKEGKGGYFVYLDIPVEGIYNGNKLLIDRLPKFQHISKGKTSSKMIKPDFTIDETSIKKILPYIVSLEDLDNINIQKLEYVQFPIVETTYSDNEFKKEDNKNTVGTYTIFNDRKPYIRIKLLKSLELPLEDELNGDDEFIIFDVEYPTSNINFIRNSFLKLREVNFDSVNDLTERKILKLQESK